MDKNDAVFLGAVGVALKACGNAALVVAKIPVARPGILGAIGLMVEAPVIVPAAGVVAAVAGVGYVGYKVHKHLNSEKNNKPKFLNN
jgi:hypothetical protein